MASKSTVARKRPAAGAADAQSPDKPLLAADRIRRTAREMFYRDGIRAVGVDAIVTQAGVTKPSLYRSFASRTSWRPPICATTTPSSGGASTPPATRIRAIRGRS